MKKALIVAETFYSIQGEGQTVGIPAVFLRLAGCNLLCEGAGWRCDTIEVWQKGKHTLFDQVLSQALVTHIHNGAHLVITGGEPLMQQQAIFDYLNWFFKEYAIYPTIEIETNGTIIPIDGLFGFVDYWNVSPKLPNSGEPYAKRVNEVALKMIMRHGDKFILKFVIKEEADLFDLYEDYGFLDLKSGTDLHRVMLMPAGATQEELAITMPVVAELCKVLGYRFSPRMHVDIWNKKTGV